MTVGDMQWTEAQLTDAYRQEMLRLQRLQTEAAQGTRNSATALLWIGVFLVAMQLVALLIGVL